MGLSMPCDILGWNGMAPVPHTLTPDTKAELVHPTSASVRMGHDLFIWGFLLLSTLFRSYHDW